MSSQTQSPFHDITLLGLVATARSGKDTTAEAIGRWAKERGYQGACVGFGHLIRREIFHAFPQIYPRYEDDKEHWRPFLQLWGEAMKLKNPRHYEEQLERVAVVNPWRDGIPKLFLVPDCRTEEDVAWVGGHGGHVIGVIRPDAPRVAEHNTETSAARLARLCEHRVINDGVGKHWQDRITEQVNATLPKLVKA